jgi:hypothetical protein
MSNQPVDCRISVRGFWRARFGIRTVLTAPSHDEAVTTGERRSDEKVAAAITMANEIGKRIKIDSSKSKGKSKPPRHWPAYNRTVLSMLVQSAMFSDETGTNQRSGKRLA